ncbi:MULTISPECIES: sugar transferase [unclassified Saccharicrinis]|uniref:sugar transferase n=1 Tax=unclassified Saccharicrinis TaxID=2646859 RepID=UPI003D359484
MRNVITSTNNTKDVNLRAIDEYVGRQHNLYKKNLIKGMSEKVYRYVSQAVPLYSDKIILAESYHPSNYYKLEKPVLGIVDVSPVNSSENINQYLFNLNGHIPEATVFVGCYAIDDLQEQKHKSFIKRSLHFQRVKKNRLISKAEALGRLVYAGFSIIDFKEIEGLLYFMTMKVKNAPGAQEGCSTGFLFPMTRIGQEGKELKVFKFRTMHPYSQYLQDYVVRLNGYNSTGKPAGDFRLTSWGRFFRKYWLDELPQLINLFKGELALVGVRPLSHTRFSELPKEVQELRVKFKPGCIPPYVSLLMPDSSGNIKAEWIYMNERLEKGFRTDIKYFLLAIRNILAGRITSS